MACLSFLKVEKNSTHQNVSEMFSSNCHSTKSTVNRMAMTNLITLPFANLNLVQPLKVPSNCFVLSTLLFQNLQIKLKY